MAQHERNAGESAPPPARARAARTIAGLLAAGALSTLILYPAGPAAWAQRSDSATVQTPFGRAPLSFADIVDRVRPAVVSISVSGRSGPNVAQNDKDNRRGPGGRGFDLFPFPDLPEDHPLRRFFDDLPRGTPSPRPTQAQGSGFVISEDGYIVTNNHVIDKAQKISVSFDPQNKYDAKLIGTDPRTDIAVLKIQADKKLPYVKFAAKAGRVGDWVLAVGNPFGLGGTVTAGIISALAREIGSGPYDYIQIDAAVNRGNSGGPTFNLDGEVIGINTAIFSPSGGNVGIAFAVPSEIASKVVAQLKDKGTVARGWLGVKIQTIDEDMASSLGLPKPRGALVNEVTSGGPAASAGLKSQDAILSVNGAEVADSRDLALKIAEYAPGTTVDVAILRANKQEVVKVKLGQFPGSQEEIARLEQGSNTSPEKAEFSDLGLALAQARGTRGGGGVEITEVDPSSDAAAKGLKNGDVIVEVQGRTVSTPEEVDAVVKQAKELGRKAVLLTLRSDNQRRVVAVQMKG